MVYAQPLCHILHILKVHQTPQDSPEVRAFFLCFGVSADDSSDGKGHVYFQWSYGRWRDGSWFTSKVDDVDVYISHQMCWHITWLQRGCCNVQDYSLNTICQFENHYWPTSKEKVQILYILCRHDIFSVSADSILHNNGAIPCREFFLLWYLQCILVW